MRRAVLGLVVLLLCGAPALAVTPGEQLADPAQEARARRLSAELRCLVCQNQSIDDSDAPLAHDLRMILRERIRAGDSDGQIKAFLVARYGDYVLLRPPFDMRTLLLWLVPAAALAGGALIAWRTVRARTGPPASLSADEMARVEALLEREDPESRRG